MGVFIDEKSNVFAGLNKTPTIIVETGSNTIPHIVVIDSIIIFNLKSKILTLLLNSKSY